MKQQQKGNCLHSVMILEEIKIQKTTAYLLAGLALVALFGIYYASSASGNQPVGDGGTNYSGNTTGGIQDIYIKARSDGTYDKQEVTVKRGQPVRLHFTADPNAGCGRQLVIYGMNVRAISRSGEENVVDFTPQQAGTFEYNCGMRMWKPGKLIVA